MRYSAEASWDERPRLGIGRAIIVAISYTSAMLGCAVLIAFSADGVARSAAPFFAMPAVAQPPARTADAKPTMSSNAALIASAEARAAVPVNKRVAAKAPAKSKAAIKTARR